MNPFLRWWRFNLVGAMGMALQLTTVAALNRLTPNHYLLASAAAVELTLIHNFLWHLRYTWRDRRDSHRTRTQLVRFHLSNGAVSMLGNLALMPVLVGAAHLPVVASNAVVIVCCSLANFGLGHNYAFAAPDSQRPQGLALSAARAPGESPR